MSTSAPVTTVTAVPPCTVVASSMASIPQASVLTIENNKAGRLVRIGLGYDKRIWGR